MEQAGVLVDVDGLETFGKYLSEQMEELQQMVYDEAGHSFKIGSPKQLGDVLFGETKIAAWQKDQDGLFHQCRNFGIPARRIPDCRPRFEVAAGFQVEIDVH